MIPGEIFTSFAEFQRIVSVNDFLASSSAPGTSFGSSGFPEKFLFCTGRIVTTELYGALVIFVVKQMSQIRSFGK